MEANEPNIQHSHSSLNLAICLIRPKVILPMNPLMLDETKNPMLVHIIGLRSTIPLQSAPDYLKKASGCFFLWGKSSWVV